MGKRLFLLAGVLFGGVLASGAETAGPQVTQPRADYSSGAYLYRTFCASCHGEAGKGDGPVADLSDPRAPDITKLQQTAGGVYPRARVLAVLDGTLPLKAHGGAGMPKWSRVLKPGELAALVAHVEALQVK